MKKYTLSILLLFNFIIIGFSQNNSSVATIQLPDSSQLVFHNIPFVNIEIHDVKVRSVFDYKTTSESVKNIQTVLKAFNFINEEYVDSVNVVENRNFVELFKDAKRNNAEIISKLSEISGQYSQRYVCVVFQYGFSSTPLLYEAKVLGNKNAMSGASISNFGLCEINIIASSQILFVVFDKVSESIIYSEMYSRMYQNNSGFFTLRETQKQMLYLKRKLKRNIIKNLRKRGHAF